MPSPLDQTLMSRPRARQPYPDAQQVREQQRRNVAKLPADYSGAALKGDSPATSTALAALVHMEATVGNLRDAARESSYDKLAPAAKTAVSALDKKLSAAAQTVATQIAHYEKGTAERTQPRIPDALGTEIRAYVRGSPTEAVKAATSDARCASALLSAPAILTGLTPNQIDQVRSAAIRAHAPEQAALPKEARRAAEKLEGAQLWSITNLSTKASAWAEAAGESKALEVLRG